VGRVGADFKTRSEVSLAMTNAARGSASFRSGMVQCRNTLTNYCVAITRDTPGTDRAAERAAIASRCRSRYRDRQSPLVPPLALPYRSSSGVQSATNKRLEKFEDKHHWSLLEPRLGDAARAEERAASQKKGEEERNESLSLSRAISW